MNNKGSILVVEDTHETLVYLTRILQDEGYTVYPADSGELALASLGKIKLDLILLDVILPGMDGIEVCRRLKTFENYATIPVIFLSAISKPTERVEGLQLGAIDYITKPFNKDELLIKVKTHLEIFRLNTTLKLQTEQIKHYNEQLLDFNHTLEEKVRKRTEELEQKNKEYIQLNEELTYAKIAAEQSEERLRTAYHYARSLLEASLDPMVTINADGKITDANTATEYATGTTRENLIGTDFSDYFTEPEKARSGYQQAFEQGYVIDYPLTMRSTSSKLIDVLYNASVYHDNQGKTLGLFAAARDITERKQAEEQLKTNEAKLKELNTDKDRFISILAHDLKSPFNSILGFLRLLLKNIRKYDLDKIEQQIGFINSSTQSVYNLLEDLLMWARSQSGKLPFEPQILSFENTCRAIIENMRVIAHSKEISINYFVVDKINLYADKNMLHTILNNLITNAIKFTNQGGMINIFAEESETQVTITISDNGIGMQPEIIPTLFDITKMHTTVGTADEKGTGLGLLLCKEFVEKHGGRIWAESDLGYGSDFKFTVPVVASVV